MTSLHQESFSKRLDFYWRSIAVYSIILIVYSLLRGSFEYNQLTMEINEPLVILLAFFICCTAIMLFINYYKRLSIIIGKDFITFKSRFREKIYRVADIQKIALGKDRINRLRVTHRVIKIKLNNRRKSLKIRPSSFLNEGRLVQSIARLKKDLNK
ncbi:MAG: hypothetical protein HW421_57 [Ignavibacteria bacterium]|nr:hypothetical protein [Ignavibacteria bacterium]